MATTELSLTMTHECRQFLFTAASLCSKEVGGFFYVKQENGAWIAYDPFIVPQEVTGSDVLIDQTSQEYAIMKAADEGRLEELRGSWHSHVNMGVFYSNDDDKVIERYLATMPYCWSIVVNKRAEFKGRFDIVDPIHIKEMDVKLYVEHDPSFEADVQKQLDEHVKIVQRVNNPYNVGKATAVKTGGKGTGQSSTLKKTGDGGTKGGTDFQKNHSQAIAKREDHDAQAWDDDYTNKHGDRREHERRLASAADPSSMDEDEAATWRAMMGDDSDYGSGQLGMARALAGDFMIEDLNDIVGRDIDTLLAEYGLVLIEHRDNDDDENPQWVIVRKEEIDGFDQNIVDADVVDDDEILSDETKDIIQSVAENFTRVNGRDVTLVPFGTLDIGDTFLYDSLEWVKSGRFEGTVITAPDGATRSVNDSTTFGVNKHVVPPTEYDSSFNQEEREEEMATSGDNK